MSKSVSHENIKKAKETVIRNALTKALNRSPITSEELNKQYQAAEPVMKGHFIEQVIRKFELDYEAIMSPDTEITLRGRLNMVLYLCEQHLESELVGHRYFANETSPSYFKDYFTDISKKTRERKINETIDRNVRQLKTITNLYDLKRNEEKLSFLLSEPHGTRSSNQAEIILLEHRNANIRALTSRIDNLKKNILGNHKSLEIQIEMLKHAEDISKAKKLLQEIDETFRAINEIYSKTTSNFKFYKDEFKSLEEKLNDKATLDNLYQTHKGKDKISKEGAIKLHEIKSKLNKSTHTGAYDKILNEKIANLEKIINTGYNRLKQDIEMLESDDDCYLRETLQIEIERKLNECIQRYEETPYKDQFESLLERLNQVKETIIDRDYKSLESRIKALSNFVRDISTWETLLEGIETTLNELIQTYKGTPYKDKFKPLLMLIKMENRYIRIENTILLKEKTILLKEKLTHATEIGDLKLLRIVQKEYEIALESFPQSEELIDGELEARIEIAKKNNDPASVRLTQEDLDIEKKIEESMQRIITASSHDDITKEEILEIRLGTLLSKQDNPESTLQGYRSLLNDFEETLECVDNLNSNEEKLLEKIGSKLAEHIRRHEGTHYKDKFESLLKQLNQVKKNIVPLPKGNVGLLAGVSSGIFAGSKPQKTITANGPSATSGTSGTSNKENDPSAAKANRTTTCY